ncbi:unnamed protein product [Dibothriocephalus latus]|uniref:N-acetyltransferase domain-containing protein n=1 Tax=Dibothriocephalus latus TaxID=60516 RepID=A0A3P7LAV4_DIBLA|nr:unnamed protein product [Dibothriocephalus latus]
MASTVERLRSDNPVRLLPDITITTPEGRELEFDTYLCNFERIFALEKQDDCVFGQNTAREMLHTAVGVIAVSLCSMDKTTIYAVLGKKSASTVFVISKEENCASRIIADRKPNKDALVKSKENKEFMSKIRKTLFALRNAKVGEDDEYETSCANTSEYELVFASDLSETTEEMEEEVNEEDNKGEDEEKNIKKEKQPDEDEPESHNSSSSSNSSSSGSENESSDTESEEPDYHCSRGYHTFVKSCLQRKLVIREMIEQNVFKRDSNVAIPLIGPEHRVAAVCTFHTRNIEPDKRIVHIVFMTVRKHLRRLGIGSKILDILKSTDISGSYDAVVVHADNNADLIIERYKRQVAYQMEETNRYRLRLKYMGENKEGAWSAAQTGRLPLHLEALDLRVAPGCDEIYQQLTGNFSSFKALTPIGDL